MQIIGHEKQLKRLAELVRQEQLANTLLFTGSPSIGKKLVAQHAATLLLQTEDIGNIEQLTHQPDFHHLDCEGSKVADVRQVLSKLALKSFNQQGRVLLLDNADQLSVASANILLKSLEEPRPGVYYFLIASNPSRLPITVLSRCQRWHFNDLSPEQNQIIIEHALPDIDLAKDEITNIINQSDSLDTSLGILKNYELWSEVEEITHKLLDGQIELLSKDFKKLIKDREKLKQVLFFMQLIVRQKTESATKLSEKRQLALLLQNLGQAYYYVFDRNLNSSYLLNQIITGAVSGLERSGPQLDIEELIV